MLKRLRSFFQLNSTISRLRDFLNSSTYPAVVALLTLIGYISGIEVWTVSLLVFITAFGVLVTDDLRPVVPPLLMVPFSFTLEHSPGIPNHSDYYTQTWIFVWGAFLCVVLLSALVLHYILWGGARRTFLSPSRLSSYHVLLAIGLLLNGLGTTDYVFRDFTEGLVHACMWILLYMIFLRGLKYSRESLEHFCVTCQWVAILLLAELVYVFLVNNVVEGGMIFKTRIVFGWGIQNNFGGIMAWLIPPIFYLASMRRRTGWIQLLLSVLVMVSIFISMCRSALLVGGCIYILCLVMVCFIGQNKELFRMFSCGIVLTAVVVLIFFHEELLTMFAYYLERGLDSSGRVEIWGGCMKNFLNYPMFGAGFHSTPFAAWSGRAYGYAHNTIVQLLGSCGLVATLAYLAMRAKTLWMVIYKWNPERVFLGVTLAALLGVSLLDNHMFNVYPAFFYAIAVAFIENDFDKVAKPLSSPLLRYVDKHRRKSIDKTEE